MKIKTVLLITMLLMTLSATAQGIFDFQPGAVCVAIENLNLRASDDIGSRILTTMKAGTEVTVLKRGREQAIDCTEGCWFNVLTPDGRIGWCFSEYLMEQPDPDLTVELLATAGKSTLGKLEIDLSRKLRGGLCLDGERMLFSIDLHRINESSTQDQVSTRFWIILWATEIETGKRTIRLYYSGQVHAKGNQNVEDNYVVKTEHGYGVECPEDRLEPFLPWMAPGLYDVATYVVFDDNTFSKGTTTRIEL